MVYWDGHALFFDKQWLGRLATKPLRSVIQGNHWMFRKNRKLRRLIVIFLYFGGNFSVCGSGIKNQDEMIIFIVNNGSAWKMPSWILLVTWLTRRPWKQLLIHQLYITRLYTKWPARMKPRPLNVWTMSTKSSVFSGHSTPTGIENLNVRCSNPVRTICVSDARRTVDEALSHRLDV